MLLCIVELIQLGTLKIVEKHSIRVRADRDAGRLLAARWRSAKGKTGGGGIKRRE